MRTTLTLDRDVAEALAKEMRRSGRGLKATINEALRRGLRLGGKPPRPPRFKVRPQALGLRPGIDPDRLNQLVDELEEDQSILAGVMVALGFTRRSHKEALGWAAEKLGRLKPNGRWREYSPLSRLVELEALVKVLFPDP